jgi:SAM-dependent methyltransferase
MAEAAPGQAGALPDFVVCPACRSGLELDGERLMCASCGTVYPREQGVPLLFATTASSDDVERVQTHYDHVAHEYDRVFAAHVTRHYLDKRLDIVRSLLVGGRVLDVGCGTGLLAAHLAGAGYEVVGVDASPGMLAEATGQGLAGAFAAFSTGLPFADNSFDLALSVATLHHLETPVRVAFTIAEMGRVVRPGGHVLLWDHNPLNPYWPILMKRVPQDSGDERLVPMAELLADVRAAGLRPVAARRLGLVPDFVPANLMLVARAAERIVESVPPLSLLAAHNVVIARKP